MSAPPKLDLRIAHTFDTGFHVDVAFTATSGTLALFGPSGSGKSTILAAIAGLLRPQGGTVRLGDRVLFDRATGVDLAPRHRGVGLVVQEGLLFPLLSVRENLLFGAPKAGARLTLEQVAGLLEIDHLLERRPRTLSGGERQRVALGRAILSEPRLLLCDEPFAALDAARRARLVPILARITDALEIPLVVVSHDVSEVLALADEVVVLANGTVEAQGPTDTLLTTLAVEDGAALNFWEGRVEGSPEAESSLRSVRVGEHLLWVPLPEAEVGQAVRLTVAPRHVALTRAPSQRSSVRNRLDGTVVAMAPLGGMLRVTVDCGGLTVSSTITPNAARDLELAAGTEVAASFKAAAVEVLALARGR